MDMRELLEATAKRAASYHENLDQRAVIPSAQALADLKRLDEPLPGRSTAPEEVLTLLDSLGSPATMATTGGRFFGFVTGGTLPAALVANWMAGAWDQNAALIALSPVAAKLEEVAIRWLLDVLHLASQAGVGFVTCATAANFTGLAAARHALLDRVGWNVESQGLFGAPPITVIVGEEVHVSALKALSLLGLGRDRVVRVPVDSQGRMRTEALPVISGLTIVCLQAGNVNSGGFDPAREICAKAHQAGAWVHVDGAFGLWTAASPQYAHLVDGVDEADSWATDAHKWLNVPYDSGLAFCRDKSAMVAAMSTTAAYLVQAGDREPYQYTPDFSRRARGVEVWAALRSLGREGLADLIARTCGYARQFADGLAKAGYHVLNDVVINQVLVSFGDSETTRRVIADLQADGTCWCGGTVWQGQTAMRISVSSWATTPEDVAKSLDAMLRIAAKHRSAS